MFEGLPGYGMVANGMDAQNPQDGLLAPKNLGLLGLIAGLAKASGPSRMPQSFGQVVGEGLLGGVGAYQQGAQIQRQDTQDKLLNMKLRKEIDAQDQWNKLFASGGAPSAAAGGTGVSDQSAAAVGAPWAAASTLPQPEAAPTGPNLDQIGRLGGLDPVRGKFALDWWKAQNPDLKFEGGMALDPRTGQPKKNVPAVPQTNQQGFSTFLKFNPQSGQYEVNLTPGGTSAFETQQGIAEGTKARFDPFMGVQDDTGKPIPMTRGQFADTYNPRPAPAPVSGGGNQPIVPTGFAATEADALKRVQDATRRGEISTITVDPSKAGGMGMTSPQKTALETAAKGDADRVQTLEAKIPSLLSVQRRLDRMEALTKDDRSYAAAGSELKTLLGSVAQSFGLNVNKAKTANSEEYLAHVAELLKDRLSSKDYGSGTGISNLDMLSAQKPLPDLAKTSQGRLQLINALRADAQRSVSDAQAARDYFDSNSGLRGFRFPSELEAEQQKKTDDLKRITSGGGGGGGQPAPAGKGPRYNPATHRIEGL